MSSRRGSQGSRGSSRLPSSARQGDGSLSRSGGSSSSSSGSSSRRSSAGSSSSMGAAGRGKTSTSSRLQEISIPEGMDEEEDESDGLDRKAKQLVLNSAFASMINDSDPDKFDRAKLVEVLTAPYIEDSGDGIVALDPHALKKLFTTTSSLLQDMGIEGERKRLEMAGATGAIEEGYRQGLTAHATRLNKVQDSLDGVEHRFRETAHKAVRIGDRLSKMEGQRARAAEAMELLDFFKVFDGLPEGFSEDQDTVVRYMKLLPAVFSDEDRRAEAAAVLAKLKSVTHELESKELDVAAKNLQAYSDFLEQELLDLFERAAGRSPPEVELMRECSDILFALNEGDHLQSRFVFFVVTQELQRGDVDQSAASAGSLSGLFRRVVTVCQNQFAVIGKVFPPPLVAKVTRLLLSRILNDPVYGVQARVEQVLSPQPPMEPLPLPDYLNCLCTVEQQTAALFGMLKEHDFIRAGGGIANGTTGNGGCDGDDDDDDRGSTDGTAAAATAGSGGGDGEEGDKGEVSRQMAALRKYLDDQAKHMFFDHRLGYAAKERRHLLETLLGTSETVWEGMLHYRVAAGQAVTVGLEAFPAVRDDKIGSYLQVLSGPLRPSVWGGVFACSAETVRRCRTIIVDEEEREQKVCEFFQIVCRYLGDHLLTPALRCANNLLPKPASNAASAALREMKGGAGQLPPREFYEALKMASKAAAGLEDHHREVIVAKGMENTPTLTTIASETKKTLLNRVDAWTVRVLEDALRLLVLYAEKQMTLRSSKSDYSPKEESAAIEATKTVKVVSAVLEEQHRVFVDCLNEAKDMEHHHRVDLRMLWEAVGLRVHELFVEHLKKSKVNVIGAFILANDVNRLQEVLGSFGCEVVTAAAEQLREIVNLYVVPPENLTSLMEQGMLAEMETEELVGFVRMRADYHTGVGSRAQWAKELFPHDDQGVNFAQAFGGGG
eukprot:g9629.t1